MAVPRKDWQLLCSSCQQYGYVPCSMQYYTTKAMMGFKLQVSHMGQARYDLSQIPLQCGRWPLCRGRDGGLWWPTVSTDAHAYAWECNLYQKKGRSQESTNVPHQLVLPLEPFQKWGLDFVGPFKTPWHAEANHNFRYFKLEENIGAIVAKRFKNLGSDTNDIYHAVMSSSEFLTFYESSSMSSVGVS